MLIQTNTYVVIAPIYLTIHLLKSPVAKSISTGQSNNSFIISTDQLLALPISITLGFVVPTVLLSLRSLDLTTTETFQRLVAFWQAFPVWTLIIQRLLIHYLSPTKAKQLESPTSYLAYASRVYQFVILMAIISNLISIVPTLTPSSIFTFFNPFLSTVVKSNFSDVFIPSSAILGKPMQTFTRGVLTFAQADFYVGDLAMLIWAVLLQNEAKAMPKNKPDSTLKLLFKVAGWTLIGGPIAATAILLWERDEILVKENESKKIK
jgi:hypothetical protein